MQTPTICRNGNRGLEFWFCQSYGNRPADLNDAGLCGHCATEAMWDSLSEWDGLSEPPSFMQSEVDL